MAKSWRKYWDSWYAPANPLGTLGTGCQRVPLDARNATRARRARIAARVFLEPNFKLVFLESNCDDPAVIAANIALKASVDDPDYSGLSHEEVVEEYTHGIKQCEAVYETMEQAEWEGMPEETEEERLKLVDAAAEVPDPSNSRVSFATKEIANSVSYMKITDTGGQVSQGITFVPKTLNAN